MSDAVFEIYDAQGRLQLDLSSSITKHLGVRTVTSSGSFTDTRIPPGRGWAVLTPSGNSAGYATYGYRAWVEGNIVRYEVSVSNITLVLVHGSY